MTSYIIQAVVGAVMGFVGNYIPFIKNNQSTIMNVVLGLVGSVGGNALAGVAGLTSATGLLGGMDPNVSSIGTGVVGSLVTLVAGKFFGKKS